MTQLIKKSSVKSAQTWIEKSPLVLDTETTGLSNRDEIIEIAVHDINDNIVFYSTLRPSVDIHPKAEEVHQISRDSLANEPTWNEIIDQLRVCLQNKTVIIFNVDFDIRLLKQTAIAFGDDAKWLDELETRCAMYLAADHYGATNRYGSISLANAMRAAGTKLRGKAHTASADVLATIDVVKAIAEQ
ncbi:3'-5' exonuclease [uncultured Shewanella sp.]|uniref:3'-5' exonuclease n=1 Tax=uncultured Shewanella sp. TaxID=173975 RepID=UPI002613C341|nr:3'-5' exonuclease [uncultured Shewanella sp.]